MRCDDCYSCHGCVHYAECYGEGVSFQRLRRITGYLVGDVSRWNDGKRAELNDRQSHTQEK